MSKLTLGLCSDYMNGHGIFKILTDNFDVPWKTSIPNGQVLDDDYYCNRSANKIVSPYVEKLVDENGLDDSKLTRIANVIFTKYGENWERMALALAEEYNPIHNYDGTEEITESETVNGTRNNSVNRTGSGSNTQSIMGSGTFNHTANNSDTLAFQDRSSNRSISGAYVDKEEKSNDTKSYGKEYKQERINAFNSPKLVVINDSETLSGVGNDGSAGQGSGGEPSATAGNNNVVSEEGGTITERKYGVDSEGVSSPYSENTAESGSETHTIAEQTSDTNSNSQSLTGTDSSTSNETGSETNETEREHHYLLEKGGNLGVTTTQQMLTSEYDFRKLYSLFDSLIFPDVDKVLCLNIFGCEDLTLDDFTIINESSYTLPVASANILGGIKIGANLTINSDGTLSADIPQGVVTETELQTILTNYVDTNALTTALANYVTSQGLSETLASYITSSSLSTILESYITSTSLATTLQDYVQTTDLTTALANYVLGTTYETFKEPTYYNELYGGKFYVIDKERLVNRDSETNLITEFNGLSFIVPFDGYFQFSIGSKSFRSAVFTTSALNNMTAKQLHNAYQNMTQYNIRVSVYNASDPARTLCLDIENYHSDMIYVKRGMQLTIELNYYTGYSSKYTRDMFFEALDLRILPFNKKTAVKATNALITNSPLYLGKVSEANKWTIEARGFDPHCCISNY